MTPTFIPSVQPSTKSPTETPTSAPTNPFPLQYLFAKLDLYAGNGVAANTGDGGPATSAGLSRAAGLWMDSLNQMYIVDYFTCNVRLVSAAGIINTIGGSSTCPSSAMSTNPIAPFTSVTMFTPWGVWGDTTGDFVYISDFTRIWKYEVSTGIVSVLAGGATAGYSGDGGSANQSSLNVVKGIYVDLAGDLYLSSNSDNRIRRISAKTQIITTVAGNGTSSFGGDGGPATRAALRSPFDVWVDSVGSIYIADNANYRIRKVSPPPLSIITTIAGNGGFIAVDGVPATSSGIRSPRGIKGDKYGRLYIAESANNRIRMLIASDDEMKTYMIYTIVGTGASGTQTTPSLALSPIRSPNAVFITSDYHLYFSESSLRVRFTSPNGSLPTFQPSSPPSIFPSPSPTLIPTPSNSVSSQNPFYEMDLVVGSGSTPYNGDNLPAGTSTNVNSPAGIWVDSNGVVYFVDAQLCALRRINLNGTVSVVGGTISSCGWGNDGSGPFEQIKMSSTYGLTGDTTGLTLYVSDSTRLWKYNVSSGFTDRIAGKSRTFASAGDGGSAINATYNNIRGLWLTSSQNLYLTEISSNRVRVINMTTNIITTVAGSGSTLGDNGLATLAKLSAPFGVYVDTNGLLFIADSSNQRVRRVSLDGIITTIAGGGTETVSGWPATLIVLRAPRSIVGDSAGSLFVGEFGGYRVMHLDPLINGTNQVLNCSYIAYIVVGTGTVTSTYSFPQPALSPINSVFGLWLTPAYNLYVTLPGRVIVARANVTTKSPTSLPTTLAKTIMPTASPILSPTFTSTVFPTVLPFYSDLFYQMSLIVGSGVAGYNGDNLPAGTSTLINRPSNLWVSSEGTIYFTDVNMCLIRKISDNGIVGVIGGNRTCQRGPSFGHLASLPLQFPYALVGDHTGKLLYIGDSNVIWRLDVSTGFAEVIAGNMTQSVADGTEGSVTSVRFNSMRGLWWNSANSLYITDFGNYRIRVLNLTSMEVRTVAGNGTNSFHGDNGPATLACISSAFGIWESTEGNIFFADRGNNRIRRISSQGKITTIAGNGIAGYVEDAVSATSTQVNAPRGLIGDSLGNIYIGEYSNRVRILVPQVSNNSSETFYTIYTIAGNGQCCGGNDIAPALSPIGNILGIWLTTSYHLYLAEGQSRVRVISPRIPITATPTSQPTFAGFRLTSTFFSQVRLVVGNGTAGYNGNNLPAGTSTLIRIPLSLWTSSRGDLYFSEAGNCLIRKVDVTTGLVTNIGGSPKNCAPDKNQQHAPFTSVTLNTPFGVAGDTIGKNLYVADVPRIFRVDLATMNATLLAGNSSIRGFNGDNHSPAKNATFRAIRNIWLNTNGILFIADQQNHRVRAINVQEETIVTIAGNGTSGFSGDSLSARNAMLYYPWDVFQDSNGILFISDSNNHRIRRVSEDGIITTIAGTGSVTYNGDQILATLASLAYPRCVRGDSIGILYVADSNHYRIRSLQPVWSVGNNVEYVIDTVAGTGISGGSIYPSLPLSSVSYVYAMWLTTDSRLYLSESNSKIRVLMPSFNLTSSPTCHPTEIPSLLPSYLPSIVPSYLPSSLPTEMPTDVPTLFPSITPTLKPTEAPSICPSFEPSIMPTTNPSEIPSPPPTCFPTTEPTRVPTHTPSESPSNNPSTPPTSVPTCLPTADPSIEPTIAPSRIPTNPPSYAPTLAPTYCQTSTPSSIPTINPTTLPTMTPTLCPTLSPTISPSKSPTIVPTLLPTFCPSLKPSRIPTSSPAPTLFVSYSPTFLSFTSTVTIRSPSNPISPRFQGSSILFGRILSSMTSSIETIDLTTSSSGSISASSAYILFGKSGSFPSSMDVSGTKDRLFYSKVKTAGSSYLKNDVVTRAIANVGDINKDGIDDLLVGYPLSAMCFLYYGKEDWTNVPVKSVLYGGSAQGRLGWAVAGIGDMNKDGFKDVIVSDPYDGVCYIINGQAQLPTAMQTSQVGSIVDGFKIVGSTTASDNFVAFGVAVSSAGDMNSDGYNDVVISGLRMNSLSVVYIIYGSSNQTDIILDSSLKIDPMRGFRVVGSSLSFTGFSLASIGDINADGFDDIAMNSMIYSSTTTSFTTERVYIIYGNSTLFPSGEFLLSSIARYNATVIENAGFMVGNAGDLNQDGIPDLMMISFKDWRTRTSSYLITYPSNYTSNPTTAPSSNPTSWPSTQPTSIPSSSEPSSSPTLPKAASPSSDPSISFPSTLDSNGSVAPVISPTFRPSFIPTLRPTRIPTTVKPTVQPTMHPTHCPSVQPQNPSVIPSKAPSKTPTFSPTVIPTKAPTHRPSFNLMPTSTPSSVPTNSQSTPYATVTISSTGKYEGDEGKKQLFVITSPIGGTVTIEGKRGIKIYMVYPPTTSVTLVHSLSSSSSTVTKVVIGDFDVESDILDFSQIPSMQSMADLTYSTSPLTIRLMEDEVHVILSSHSAFDLVETNFVFATGESNQSENNVLTLGDSAITVPLAVLIGCLIGTYYLLHCYSKNKKVESKVKVAARVIAVNSVIEKGKEQGSVEKIKEEVIPELTAEDLEKQSPGLVRRHLERKRVLVDAVQPQPTHSQRLAPKGLVEQVHPPSNSSSGRSSSVFDSNGSTSFSRLPSFSFRASKEEDVSNEEQLEENESDRHSFRSFTLTSFASMRSRLVSFMSYDMSDEEEENNSESDVSDGSESDDYTGDELSFFSSY